MDKISNERKAQIFYQGDGTQTQYSFPFDYLRKAFVHVSLISDEKSEELTQGKDYTVNDRQVTLVAPTGLKIKIYRVTTTKPLVGWADASVLKAADMTVQATQLLHLAEETSDIAQEGGLSKDGADNIWDARYNKIKNLLDPTAPGDAVNLNYITKNQNSLLTQLRDTGAAQNASIEATGDAQFARVTTTGDEQNKRLTTTGDTQKASIEATGDAQLARVTTTGDDQNKQLTTTGDTQNTRLVTTGNSYVSTMTTLKDTTTTKATEANNSADLAKKWAVSPSSPDGATDSKSSKTWAEASHNSVDLAKKWAVSTSSPDGATDSKSSKTWAEAAKAFSDNAAAFASASQSSAESSASYVDTASSSANAAKDSAAASANSASAAYSSASNAATSASNAKTSETKAAESATAAAKSAVEAAKFDPTTYAKYNETFVSTETGRKVIEDAGITDLNDVKVVSYPSWTSRSASTAASLSNCPVKTAFFLYNIRTERSSTEETLPNLTSRYYYVVQYIIDISGNVWMREAANNAKETFTFGAWKKLATVADFPTKTSQLTNDSGFTTVADLPTKTSQLTNDSGFAAVADLPTKTSQLTNDSGFAVISNGHLVINESELWIE